MKNSHFSRDIQEFLVLLAEYNVQYLIVGGEAVIYYGYARLTGDIDIYYNPSIENINKLYEALNEFWEGDIPEIKKADELGTLGSVIQFGVPPNRIDIMNQIESVTFSDCWKNKKTENITYKKKSVPVHYIGLAELIKNKESLKRNKDLEDLKYLKQITDIS
jgi:hypothetical protein